MTDIESAGPDPDEITAWITSTHPDTVIATAMGATFFSLDEKHWPNFATIVTTDEHDDASNLSRPAVFRLNIGVGRETFERLVGDARDPDFTAIDRLLPHPVYARQRCVAILNPSRRTFDELLKPLIAEAYERVARTQRRRTQAAPRG